jgi:hypothetical protein
MGLPDYAGVPNFSAEGLRTLHFAEEDGKVLLLLKAIVIVLRTHGDLLEGLDPRSRLIMDMVSSSNCVCSGQRIPQSSTLELNSECR